MPSYLLPWRQRAGFTLIEATIAMTVMVAALLITVGQFANLRTAQRNTQGTVAIDRMLQSLVERFGGVTWSDIGTVNAPWSAPRFEPATGINACPAMTETTTTAMDNLVGLGLLATPTNLPFLKVYVEYWRAVNYRDGSGGIDGSRPGALESSFTSTNLFNQNVYIDAIHHEQGLKSSFRLSGWSMPTAAASAGAANSPTAQVGPDDPLLIRIVATWGDEKGSNPTLFRRELFCMRAP